MKTIIYTRLGISYSDWDVSERLKEFLERKYLHIIRVSSWNFVEALRVNVMHGSIDPATFNLISEVSDKAREVVITENGSIAEKRDHQLLFDSVYTYLDLENIVR